MGTRSKLDADGCTDPLVEVHRVESALTLGLSLRHLRLLYCRRMIATTVVKLDSSRWQEDSAVTADGWSIFDRLGLMLLHS